MKRLAMIMVWMLVAINLVAIILYEGEVSRIQYALDQTHIVPWLMFLSALYGLWD